MKSFSSVLIFVAVFAVSTGTVEEERRRTFTTATTDSEVESVVRVASHPTVKCEHIIPMDGEKSSSDNHRACNSHCRNLEDGLVEGKCFEGMCHCKHDTGKHEEKEHPTVKCVDLLPENGRPHSENHEACETHCKSLGNGYRNGQCVKGICSCRARTQQQ